ncbi:hypothetical protein F5I97DRAFT_1835366 [Phlebopus sp. FC_14]|nr:hypothetical protein F5I97DRAFT_1835366 [Phlebopus sp. FC_14]
MSTYVASGRPTRRRSRTQSDPGHQYLSPPYRTRWPTPARRTTEPTGMNSPSQRMHSRSSSVERNVDGPFVPSSGSLVAQAQISGSLMTGPSTPISPHSPSVHHQSPSQARAPRMEQGPLIKETPQPSQTAPVAPTPQKAGLGQASGSPPTFPMPQQQSYPPLPPPSPVKGTNMIHEGSHHTMHQQTQFSAQHSANTHLTHHTSLSRSNPHHSDRLHSHSYHSTRGRSRSRPPSAASHRYTSTITPPVYGHGGSGSANASRTSLHTGGTPPRNHSTGPPGVPASSVRPSANPVGAQGISHSHVRPHPSTTTVTTTHSHIKPNETHSSAHTPTPPAKDIHRTTQRPIFPGNYNGQTQTRYVNMLLALDDIPPLFNLLASFFTWILLAGFILFPGTFASWKNSPTTDTEQQIIGIVNNIPLYVIAWVCTAIGASGMIWLWWRWQNNYIWITNRVFIPGLMNSVAGVISTLTSVYGAQGGVFSYTAKSTIIVTGAISVICGLLFLVYQFWLLRNIKKEHDREVGVEKAGQHGEGVLGEKKGSRKEDV